MTVTRWLWPVLLTGLALGACTEQEAGEAEGEMDAGLEADTMTMAQEPPYGDTSSADLAVWNTDADARLASNEFDAWLEEQDFYGRWNTDGADGLTAEEFGAGLVGVLDTNDDGTIASDEWEDNGIDWFGDEEPLEDWDGDGDGSLSESELVAGIQQGDRWGEWDQDGNGQLNRAEFHTAIFEVWDANDDDFVDESEWGENFDLWS